MEKIRDFTELGEALREIQLFFWDDGKIRIWFYFRIEGDILIIDETFGQMRIQERRNQNGRVNP